MYEIQRQRQLAGMYDRNMSEETVEELFDQWKLGEQKYDKSQFFKRPSGPMPESSMPHSDGRAVRKFPKIKAKDE
jgi:hypothetical protein